MIGMYHTIFSLHCKDECTSNLPSTRNGLGAGMDGMSLTESSIKRTRSALRRNGGSEKLFDIPFCSTSVLVASTILAQGTGQVAFVQDASISLAIVIRIQKQSNIDDFAHVTPYALTNTVIPSRRLDRVKSPAEPFLVLSPRSWLETAIGAVVSFHHNAPLSGLFILPHTIFPRDGST
jgi:hypothetical protein